MRSNGVDVISLAAGEPDFGTPICAATAGQVAIEAGRGRYTATRGLPALREAIVAFESTQHGLEYDVNDVIVTTGAKQALFNAIYATCDPGDEMLIFAPYWTSYPDMALSLGVKPVVVPTFAADGFRPRLEEIRSRITPRTRAIVVNSPNNPTGAWLAAEALEPVTQVVRDHDLWVISDDIYAALLYDGREFANVPMAAVDLMDRTIVINGASKTFGMTGWRIGYAAGPSNVIEAMATFQGHTTSCADAIAQEAATAAFRSDPAIEVAPRVEEFARRARFVRDTLQSIPGVECPQPEGAFYVFPDVSELLGRRHGHRVVATAFDLADVFLDVAHVACVPGDAFGSPNALRFSYAADLAQLEEAFRRIARVISELEST